MTAKNKYHRFVVEKEKNQPRTFNATTRANLCGVLGGAWKPSTLLASATIVNKRSTIIVSCFVNEVNAKDLKKMEL